jgi:hypothetical protein
MWLDLLPGLKKILDVNIDNYFAALKNSAILASSTSWRSCGDIVTYHSLLATSIITIYDHE